MSLPRTSSSRTALAGCSTVFVVALVLRVVGTGDRPFWSDEALTVRTVTAPDWATFFRWIWDIGLGMGPGYYLLLRGWCSVFGAGETSLRWPSALLGAAAAGAVYLWARGLLRVAARRAENLDPARIEMAALLAGAFASLHASLIGLSREARAYEFSHLLLFAGGAASVTAYLAGDDAPRARAARIATPLLVGLGVGSHLHSAFFAAGLFTAVAWVRRARGESLRPVVVGAAAFLGVVATHVPLLLHHTAIWYGPGITHPGFGLRDVAHEARLWLGGRGASIAVAPILAITAFAARRTTLVRVGLGTMAAGTLVVLVIDRAVAPVLLYPSRYLSWAVGPMALVAAAVPIAFARRGVIAALALVAALGFGAYEGRRTEEVYWERWDEVAAVLEKGTRAGDVVACHAGFLTTPLGLYYAGPAPMLPVDELWADDGRVAPPLAGAHAAGGRVWLVWSHAGELSPQERARLESALGRSEEVHTESAIRVLRFGR